MRRALLLLALVLVGCERAIYQYDGSYRCPDGTFALGEQCAHTIAGVF